MALIPKISKCVTNAEEMWQYGGPWASSWKVFVSGIFLKNKKQKNVSQTKTIVLSFRKHFRFANVFSTKKFSLKKKIILVSKTLSFRKCFLNEKIFVLKNITFISEALTFVSETFRKKIEKNRISFEVVAHACHPPLRASVSTWEGLICKFFYVDVWLQ